MERRKFIALVGGAAAAWPLTARAQQDGRVRRIAVLMLDFENVGESPGRVAAFEGALRDLGWNDRNCRIEYRWAGQTMRMVELAKELVDLKPDIIVCVSTVALAALLRETSTIPIVFVLVSDPVGAGLVASIRRPGGNATGFINIEGSIGGKWVQFLKEIAPRVNRIAVMFNPDTAPNGGNYFLKPIEVAASSIGLSTIVAPVRNEAEIERAIVSFASEPGGGLVFPPDPYTSLSRNRTLIVEVLARHQLPAIFPFRYWAADGGLITYANDQTDLFRRAPSYVDRILRGENPAELPIQIPVKYELFINMRTAKALGLTVPVTLQVAADEVIE